MKIKTKNRKKLYKDTKWGEIILFNDNYYIRTEYIYSSPNGEYKNEINLKTGIAEKIDDYEMVEKLKNATLLV